jgi:uncharacterized membrane protein
MQEKSSTGMELNVAGLLCYLLGLITGIIFYVMEKESSYVKFHALQSIFISAVLMGINFILALIPIFGWGLYLIVGPLSLVLWIILMIKAYQGERFKLPIIGDMVEKQLHSSN